MKPTADGGRRFLRVLPLIMMTVVAIVDLLAGPGVGYLPLLSLGPAFASLSCGVRRTAAIGALAIALCAVLGLYGQTLGTRANTLTFASIGGVIAAGMLAAGLRERNERELADVRTVAEVAQRVLLRPMPRKVGPLRAYDEPDLHGVADRIETTLTRQLTGEQFVTAIMAEIRPATTPRRTWTRWRRT